MIHMDADPIFIRGLQREIRHRLGVTMGDPSARLVESIDVTELHPQNSGLKFIEAAIVANDIMVVADLRAMIS